MIKVIAEVKDGCVINVLSTLPDEIEFVIVDHDAGEAGYLYAEQYVPGQDEDLDELIDIDA